jgi:hypothetical protein
MENIFNHEIPMPSRLSLLFVGLTTLTGYLQHLTHDDIAFYLTCTTGSCALISYGYRFIKWLNRKDVK